MRLDAKRRALNLSESSSGASAFLHAVPSSANIFMPGEFFWVAARDRLGLPPLNGEHISEVHDLGSPYLQALLAAKDLDRGPWWLSRDVRPHLETVARGTGYRPLSRQREGVVVCWCGV